MVRTISRNIISDSNYYYSIMEFIREKSLHNFKTYDYIYINILLYVTICERHIVVYSRIKIKR